MSRHGKHRFKTVAIGRDAGSHRLAINGNGGAKSTACDLLILKQRQGFHSHDGLAVGRLGGQRDVCGDRQNEQRANERY